MQRGQNRTIWSGRFSKYRDQNPPAWEAFTVPLIEGRNTLQTFEACGVADLSLDPMRAKGIETPYSIINDNCGMTERIIESLRYPFLTHRSVCRFADELVGLPPAGVTLDDCGGTLTLAYEVARIQVKDEWFKLAFVIEHIGVRKLASSVSYLLFREHGKETLAFGEADGKETLKLKYTPNIQDKLFKAATSLWQRRERVIADVTEQLTTMSNQSRTANYCYLVLDQIYPYKEAECVEPGQGSDLEVFHSERSGERIRKWRHRVADAFIQGNGAYLNTDAAWGTLLGFWFAVGELENFKAASHRSAAQMLVSGQRALRIRKAYLRLLNLPII